MHSHPPSPVARRGRPGPPRAASGPPPPPSPAVDPLALTASLPLASRRILVTAPRPYAAKLTSLLVGRGARPLWVPGVATQRLPPASPAAAALATALDALPSYAAVAFTSRAGVAAVLDRVGGARLAAAGPSLWALGADAGALTDAGVPPASVLAPREPSTRGLAAALVAALPRGARVLCPVPSVGGGLAEPPVVPRFLAALAEGGLDPVRVDAYTTLPGTAAGGAALEAAALADGAVDAVLFSSTAEAAGLALALGGGHAVTDAVARHGVLLAAHGPYTAAGVAAVLGVGVDAFVVSRDFSSFHGVVAALEEAFEGQGV